MTQLTQPQVKYLQNFNEALQNVSIFCCITRNSDLQRTACSSLREMLDMVAQDKAHAIAELDEHFANILLGCECLLSACIAEITMYLLLKEDNPDAAWDELVNAQSRLDDAMKADVGFGEDVGRQLQRLRSIEQLVFPSMVFLSTGWIVKEEICSICGSDYEECEHIKGHPYMGKLCIVELVPLEVDHVALVDNPANKHCRVTHIGTSDGRMNCLSRVVMPDTPQSENSVAFESNGQLLQGTVATSMLRDS